MLIQTEEQKKKFKSENCFNYYENQAYPRVSHILKVAGLAPDYSMVSEGTLERCSNFGRASHRLVQLIEENKLKNYDPALEPIKNGWLNFKANISGGLGELYLAETAFVNLLRGYSGTPDLVYLTSETTGTLIEIKTTSQPVKSARAQVGGYILALEDAEILGHQPANLKISEAYIVYLHPDLPLNFRCTSLSLIDINFCRRSFLAAKTLYEYKRRFNYELD